MALRSDECEVELARVVDSCAVAEAERPRQSVTWLLSTMHGLSTTFPRGSVVTMEGIAILFHTVGAVHVVHSVQAGTCYQ